MSYTIPILLVLIILITFSYERVFAESDTIQLSPTDDAYVAVNIANFADPVTELNTGDLEFLKTFYAFNATGAEIDVASLVYLKFDLSELNLDEIKSATINLNAITFNVQTTILPIYKTEQNNWDELSLTFLNKPVCGSYWGVALFLR